MITDVRSAISSVPTEEAAAVAMEAFIAGLEASTAQLGESAMVVDRLIGSSDALDRYLELKTQPKCRPFFF